MLYVNLLCLTSFSCHTKMITTNVAMSRAKMNAIDFRSRARGLEGTHSGLLLCKYQQPLAGPVYIYNPLYNKQPITRPDLHHVIWQYSLHVKSILDSFWKTVQYNLHWTVLKRGRTHPTNVTSGSAAYVRQAVEEMKVSKMSKLQQKRKRTMNGITSVWYHLYGR